MQSAIIRTLRSIKRSLYDSFVFALIRLSAGSPKQKEFRPKSMLIIRLDAIGDYVLFRNFLEIVRTSDRYRDYAITLLGNAVWRSLSEELDTEFVDTFIWLDRFRFVKDHAYRKEKLREIGAAGYEIALSPVYSRGFIFSDALVKLVNAGEKIGSEGCLSNMLRWQKKKGDAYYTRLIPARDGVLFEFDRNKEFFENFLRLRLDLPRPTIAPPKRNSPFELPRRYAVIFIGASGKFRKWSVVSFAKIAEHLKDAYGYEIVLCGGPGDKEDAEEFARSFGSAYVDLVGKTSLVDLLSVISGGSLMISNETSAPHLAVALGLREVFVIYNGDHFGRFTPYPGEMAPNYHAIRHPEIERDPEAYKTLSNGYGYRNSLDMGALSFETVKNAVDKVLSR